MRVRSSVAVTDESAVSDGDAEEVSERVADNATVCVPPSGVSEEDAPTVTVDVRERLADDVASGVRGTVTEMDSLERDNDGTPAENDSVGEEVFVMSSLRVDVA